MAPTSASEYVSYPIHALLEQVQFVQYTAIDADATADALDLSGGKHVVIGFCFAESLSYFTTTVPQWLMAAIA